MANNDTISRDILKQEDKMRIIEYYIARAIDKLSLYAYRLHLVGLGKRLNNLYLDILCR